MRNRFEPVEDLNCDGRMVSPVSVGRPVRGEVERRILCDRIMAKAARSRAANK
jgi:hypothetical protein